MIILRPYKINIFRLVSVLFASCLPGLYLVGCEKGLSQPEKDMRITLTRIAFVIEEYYKLPVKHERLSSAVLVWRDRASSDSFYKTYYKELLEMESRLGEISNGKSGTLWQDDALFGRGIIYWLLAELEPNVETQKRAVAVWSEIRSRTPLHLQEFTKTTMQRSFMNKYEAILTSTLSFEENVDVIFMVLQAQTLFLMKDYDDAIEVNKMLAKVYPTSQYAKEFVKNQIQIINDVKEGKISVQQPSHP